ncbi:ATP-dependent nuclease [Burkholderia anthina]|uniref:ATP-dependent nuclease n=1 Tax=Burkholderia anthina TaxID=179879 RepID=UPI00158A2C0B|nr:AAA family ATPase [Burkholderia anthina]
MKLTFSLPEPWKNKTFSVKNIGQLNYLVGPNGSGKSRFAATLKQNLQKCRMLGTDRLLVFSKNSGLEFLGDHFQSGFQKNLFNNFKNAGENHGSGVDTFVLLEERLDLRLRVEATLSHLFGRRISLEWDSGNLVPKATMGDETTAYRLDRDECHGIKELLVLLTHLYNDENDYLIIDEPELNLHPQYQTFFVEECRKIVSKKSADRGLKSIFLITHSPFMLDFRNADDVKSIISFDRKFEMPRTMSDCDAAVSERLSGLVSRINTNHKQLFFADNPIFVEGIWDSQIVSAVQQARGTSTAGAGSCIIYAGGCEEVNKFLELCGAFGKRAWFLYDLDSLFLGNLRSCVKNEDEVISFLAQLGLGGNFGSYCGQLDKKLGEGIDKILNTESLPVALKELQELLSNLRPVPAWEPSKLQRARVALLTALAHHRSDVSQVLGNALTADLEGRLNQICAALKEKQIILLRSGALENYLPSYAGSIYTIPEEQKKAVVEKELDALSAQMTDDDLRARFRGLFDAICALPSKSPVDFDEFAKSYIADYIHEVQKLVTQHPGWHLEDFRMKMKFWQNGVERFLRLKYFTRNESAAHNFQAELEVLLGEIGDPPKLVRFSHETNAGMKQFVIVKNIHPAINSSAVTA